MEIPTLAADKRQGVGTRLSRALRTKGRLPGILYGHGETPEAFSVSAHDLALHLEHGARVLRLDLGGAKTDCLIKDVQYDHMGRDPVHFDLARVDLTERVQVNVAIELRGTPKGLVDGGILEQLADDIEVECQAANIPDTLHPSVAHLGVGEDLLAGQIALPEGVKLLTDSEEKIAICRLLAVKAGEEEGAEEAAEGGTEPEVIGRPAKEDAEEGS